MARTKQGRKEYEYEKGNESGKAVKKLSSILWKVQKDPDPGSVLCGIDHAGRAGSSSDPSVYHQSGNAGSGFLNHRLVVKIGLLYLILRVIDSLAAYYMAYTGHVMGVYIETDMRQDAFEHLQMLSDSYYSNTKVGQIMSRITSDLFDVTEFSHHCPEEFFIAILKGIVSFVILSGINLELTLLIFLMIPIMIVSCTWFNLKVKAAFRLQRNQIGELNARLRIRF